MAGGHGTVTHNYSSVTYTSLQYNKDRQNSYLCLKFVRYSEDIALLGSDVEVILGALIPSIDSDTVIP